MRLTVSERLRRKLNQAFDAEGYGSRSRFVAFSKSRPGGHAINAQALSYFLNGHRENPIKLDDLADFAAYFRVSVSDLFDEAVSLASSEAGHRHSAKVPA